MSARGSLHHVEIWVEDLGEARTSWGWLLEELGYRRTDRWTDGESWTLGSTYLVLEESVDRTPAPHDRLAPGVNHLAFHAGSRDQVDDLVSRAGDHGWALLFADRHPFAGGPHHYAAYLENGGGFEVELVAAPVDA